MRGKFIVDAGWNGESEQILPEGAEEIAGFALQHQLPVVAGGVPAPIAIQAWSAVDLHRHETIDDLPVQPQQAVAGRRIVEIGGLHQIVEPGIAQILEQDQAAALVPAVQIRHRYPLALEMAADPPGGDGLGQHPALGGLGEDCKGQRPAVTADPGEAPGRTVGGEHGDRQPRFLATIDQAGIPQQRQQFFKQMGFAGHLPSPPSSPPCRLTPTAARPPAGIRWRSAPHPRRRPGPDAPRHRCSTSPRQHQSSHSGLASILAPDPHRNAVSLLPADLRPPGDSAGQQAAVEREIIGRRPHVGPVTLPPGRRRSSPPMPAAAGNGRRMQE